MEPVESSSLPAWRQAAVALILGGLAVALIWQVSRDPTPLPPPTSVATVATLLVPANTSVPPSTNPPEIEGSTSPTTVVPAPSSVGPAQAAEEAAVMEATKGALDAWGQFAVTGDLSVLDPWFAPEGPQYAQLVSEADALAEAPLGDPPYTVNLGSPVVSFDADGTATVAGTVTFRRAGEAVQAFAWRLRLRRTLQGWALWSVAPN